MVIVASALEPSVETHSDEVYKKTLFSRDDQLIETLNAGINAASMKAEASRSRSGGSDQSRSRRSERRPQVSWITSSRSGHARTWPGLSGALEDADAGAGGRSSHLERTLQRRYGDFSGLGVVHIRLKESLADKGTVRFQAGRFGSYRTFFTYSPSLNKADAFIAHEGSSTDGPFENPLR